MNNILIDKDLYNEIENFIEYCTFEDSPIVRKRADELFTKIIANAKEQTEPCKTEIATMSIPVAIPSIVKCDACGCHPSVLIVTEFGTFCQEHAKYTKQSNLNTI